MLRSLVVAVFSLCIIIGSWFYFHYYNQKRIDGRQQLRQSEVSLQSVEQRLNRLKQGQSHPLLKVLGEDVEDLQIRLSETFAQWTRQGDQLVTAYEQSLLKPFAMREDSRDVIGETITNLSILRLDIQASMQHSPQFLRLLDELHHATGGWPSEVRACDVQRMPTHTLDARCILDIYFWSVGVSP